MKLFLIKSFIFFCVVITIISFVLINYGGYVDYFYEKFTTPKANSMILGDSRSLQGVQPSVINNYFSNENYELPILNYSFTVAQISYGPNYQESIKRKLNINTKNGLFIISISPWVLSIREGDDYEKGEFFETGLPPNNMKYVNHSPNFEYFIKNFNYFHFKSIIRKSSKVHKDGWLEESNLPKDTLVFNKWRNNQVSMYEGFSNRWEKSNFRLKSLEKLVSFLDEFGSVILLRMPINNKIKQIEDQYWENFNKDIKAISNKLNIAYFDFSNNNHYKTYDGNHLDKYGGVIFTKSLCDSISMKLKK